MNFSALQETRLLSVIQNRCFTEKTERLAHQLQQFVFEVTPSSEKKEIKKSIELFFKVKVKSVNVANVKGKAKKFKNKIGYRKNWKKAYVSLESGHNIDFNQEK